MIRLPKDLGLDLAFKSNAKIWVEEKGPLRSAVLGDVPNDLFRSTHLSHLRGLRNVYYCDRRY